MHLMLYLAPILATFESLVSDFVLIYVDFMVTKQGRPG